MLKSLASVLSGVLFASAALAASPVPSPTHSPNPKARQTKAATAPKHPHKFSSTVKPLHPLSRIVLAPKLRHAKGPTDTTYFELKPAAGGFDLVFKTRDPKLAIGRQYSMAIQVYASGSYDVEPNVLTSEDWPKSGNRVLLKVTGRAPVSKAHLEGKASYTVCNTLTKNCYRVKAQPLGN